MASAENTPHEERRICGLGNHTLKTPYRIIRNPYLLKFGRMINSELQSQPLCLNCYNQLLRMYNIKNNNARRHQAARAAHITSDSTVGSVQISDESARESTSNGPAMANASTVSSIQMSGESARESTSNGPAMANASTVSSIQMSGESAGASSSDGPTTSAAAAARRARRALLAQQSSDRLVSDDEDANSNLSLNAVNGARLPHIQPIPRRRSFVHLNKEAMDIYLAGTTGGSCGTNFIWGCTCAGV
ncbi:uncharacterized protein LOC108095963 isoform X1 [Drosophila ficusphila]|uniref:uncharacterized protein LOC108095963 isoform X1 n=1 Tax=Drosophila ficusphila TaxID=30025 RepID=UPI0007E6FAFC|nr:uncharacterized protein LOC108095963 isoform X1 [Drosophila ficusphila]